MINKENFIKACKKGWGILKKPMPLTLSEWADTNFYLSSESSYIEGRWQTVPFQKAIMNCMSNDDIREVTFMKSARLGYTKCIVAALGYYATHKRRNQCLWQPTDGDAKNFCKDEVDTMLRDVPCVRDNFPHFDMKHKDNTLEKKVLIGSTINIKGGTSSKNYRRISVDVALLDEVDGFPEDIDNEGDCILLADKRTEGSAFRKSIRGSTPKIKNFSLIEKSFESAHAQFRFYVPCPHCHEEQNLVFGGKESDHGLKWEGKDTSTVAYLCKHCGCLFKNRQLTFISERGRYIDDRTGVWTKDGLSFYDHEYEKIDTPSKVAFHIWSIYSPFTTWQQIVDDFLNCGKDQNKLKTFVNTTLGEPWADTGEEIDPNTLYGTREVYEADCPQGVLCLTAACDVQKDRIEIGVEGWGKSEDGDMENWKIDYQIIRGNPAHGKIWNELDGFIKKTYKRSDGQKMHIACTCIDSGGLYTQETYKFTRPREMRRVFSVKGRSTPGSPVVNRPVKSNVRKVTLYTIGTDTAKDFIFGRLTSENPKIHFPVKELFDQEYFAQLCGEQCITTFVNGRPVRKWKKIRARQEVLDICVYNLAAYYILNPNLEVLSQKQAPVEEPHDDNDAVVDVPNDIKKPQPRRSNQRKSQRKGWMSHGRKNTSW